MGKVTNYWAKWVEGQELTLSHPGPQEMSVTALSWTQPQSWLLDLWSHEGPGHMFCFKFVYKRYVPDLNQGGNKKGDYDPGPHFCLIFSGEWPTGWTTNKPKGDSWSWSWDKGSRDWEANVFKGSLEKAIPCWRLLYDYTNNFYLPGGSLRRRNAEFGLEGGICFLALLGQSR